MSVIHPESSTLGGLRSSEDLRDESAELNTRPNSRVPKTPIDKLILDQRSDYSRRKNLFSRESSRAFENVSFWPGLKEVDFRWKIIPILFFSFFYPFQFSSSFSKRSKQRRNNFVIKCCSNRIILRVNME